MTDHDFRIIDKKVVAADENVEMAWVLKQFEDGRDTRWYPRVKHADGRIENPVWLPLPGSQYTFLECPIPEALFEGTRGPGKGIFNDSKVLTDSGWKRVGDVTMQDRLVAPDGTYTRIKGIYPQGHEPLYRMTFDDGASIICDGVHRWSVRSAKNSARDGWLVHDTDRLIELMKQHEGKTRSAKNSWYIPTITDPVPGAEWTGLDPYAIGLLLGDGTMKGDRATLYTCDDWIKNYMARTHRWLAYDYRPRQNAMMVQARSWNSDMWKDAVGRHKGADKRIPPELLEADPEARLACLQGLMDADGTIDTEGRCRFVSLSEHLAKGVQYLVRSLGGKSKCYWEYRKSPRGGVDGRWRVNVQHCNKFTPFRLPRKVERMKPMNGVDRRIVSIDPVADGPATCFEVAHPSHLFVCQDFIVTHNSLTLIMDFAKDVGKGYGKNWRGVMFRKKLGDLDDIVRKIEEWMYQLYPKFRFLKSKADYSAVWPTGETLLLRHMEDERDYGEYHGHEYPWIGWEELTQWPNDKAFSLMMSCNRPTAAGIPCRIRSTTNPFGPGHNWVKRRYQLPHMRGRVIREPGELPRVAIHGTLSENFPLLHDAPDYPAKIYQAATNPAQAKAWLHGDWDVTAGGMIDDVFDRTYHVLPEIPVEKIPKGWTITRAYDHGQSRPFSVGWFLESNGEPIVIDHRLIGAVRGDIILWKEWYGTTGNDDEGIRLSARKIGMGIADREIEWGLRYPGGRSRVYPGPADTEIFNRHVDRDGRSPADDMADQGVEWERADKSAGSRKRGWMRLRNMLENSVPNPDGTREIPGFFICQDCSWWLELCPPMPRDEKDLDEVPDTYEDHCADMTRYRLSWEIPGMDRRSF